MMQFTAGQIAMLLQGRVEGDPSVSVSNIAKIEEAKEGDLSFIANPKYEEYLYSTKASVVLINETLEVRNPVTNTLIRLKDAYAGFATLLEKYSEIISGGEKKGIEQPAFIASSATIGTDVYIGAFNYIGENAVIGNGVKLYPGCYIGNNVEIGANSKLFAGVKVYDECKLGSHVVIHSGVVVGGDGFGFAPDKEGVYKKIPQIGNVVIEDHVEIGANCTIDRATMGSTVIRKGVKLDNLIMIAHNVEVGENTVIAAQTGISGSSKVGRRCVIGGQVGIVGHVQLADGTQIGAQSGVSKSVTIPNSAINSSPAFDYKSSLKSHAIFRNLPELQQRLFKLEETVQELTALLSTQNIDYKK
jgi:UDP-3-O-[3-hydroxymyristoyl] glucosamine N-acyltransferase